MSSLYQRFPSQTPPSETPSSGSLRLIPYKPECHPLVRDPHHSRLEHRRFLAQNQSVQLQVHFGIHRRVGLEHNEDKRPAIAEVPGNSPLDLLRLVDRLSGQGSR